MLRTTGLAALALTATLLAGCSSDDSPDASVDASADPSTSVSASTSAADTLVQQGLDQLAAGDTAAAQGTFQNVVAIDPENVYGHFNLGVIAQQAGDDRAAMASYDAALAIDDAFAPALFNKGILTETSDLRAAVDLYRRAVAADPEMAGAFMRLGFALVHLGEDEEGAEFLAQGIELDPSMTEVEAPSYD